MASLVKVVTLTTFCVSLGVCNKHEPVLIGMRV